MSSAVSQSPYLTIREVSARLGICESTVRKLDLPFAYLGKQRRYHVDQVDAYVRSIQSNTVPVRRRKPKAKK